MNDELMLVEPSEEYFAELAAYRNDFLENSDSMDGCGPLRRFDDMKAYLEDTMRYTREETLPEGMVPATQFLCIRKSDNRLVGMIQVRHYLNDFLRTFGTKEEFLDLDAQLAGGPVSIDLMQTSLGLSATICAAGLDAQVAYGIPKFRRIPLCGGEMAYVLSIVEQLCGHIGRRVEYTIDGETLDVDCLMCAICNGRTYGGGFCAAPEAQPDDGWLDVYIIRKVSRVTIAKLLGMYKSGKHFQNGQLVRAAEPYFIYRRAKQVSLRAADGRGPIVATADGECAPKEQIAVQVQPLAGRILLPKPAFERFAAQRTAQSADRT